MKTRDFTSVIIIMTTEVNQRVQDEAWTQRESRSRDGLHFGKGPKGYHRTDQLILNDVNEALTRDCYLDASDIEVRVKEVVVTLTGSVANREMKVLAEDCIEFISGVKDIKNELRLSARLYCVSNNRKPYIKSGIIFSDSDDGEIIELQILSQLK